MKQKSSSQACVGFDRFRSILKCFLQRMRLDHIQQPPAELLPHDAAQYHAGGRKVSAKVHRLYGDIPRRKCNLPVMHQALAVHQSPWLERAASTRHPVIVSDAQAESGANGNGALKWIRSFCVIPVVHSDRVIGFINLHSTHAGTYHAGQVEIMEAFADQAALALPHAWLYAQSQENARQIAMLNQISRAAFGASSLVEMLEIFVNGLGDVFLMDGAYLTLWDEAHHRPIPMASSSDRTALNRTAIIPNETPSGIRFGSRYIACC
jgi:GAF domain-containing protein